MAQADIYADAIGLAFQIRDDILDVIGSTEELGKPVGSDAEQQKATFATVLGTERAQSLAEKLTRTALDALKQLNVAEDDPLYEMTVELAAVKNRIGSDRMELLKLLVSNYFIDVAVISWFSAQIIKTLLFVSAERNSCRQSGWLALAVCPVRIRLLSAPSPLPLPKRWAIPHRNSPLRWHLPAW